MVIAVAICPPAPILLPGVGGSTDPGAQLRSLSVDAVGHLVDAGVERVVVAGIGPVSRWWPADAPFSAGVFTGSGGPCVERSLPVSLAVGRALWFAVAGETSPCRVDALAVAPDEPLEACLAFGEQVAGGARTGLLLMADGAPGHDIPDRPGVEAAKAEELDATLVEAVAAAEPERLAALDPACCAALGASSRAVWQVLAGAVRQTEPSRRPRPRLTFHGAPFGVTYLIATWDLTNPPPSPHESSSPPGGASE